MDKKLLEALQSIGETLEYLADVLEGSGEATSDIAKSLQDSIQGETLRVISENVEILVTNTNKILANQDKIISLVNESNAKNDPFQKSEDPSTKDKIKGGVGTVLLIAGAVLAMGIAFKIIGDVNFVSVISMSLAIMAFAWAFEKIGSMEDMTLGKVLLISSSIVFMSVGIMLSSHILSQVTPIGLPQLFTTILISGGLGLMMAGLRSVTSAFEGKSLETIVASVLFLPLILPAMSLAIMYSSHILNKVETIGFSQFITSLLISGVFVVMSFAIAQIVKSFNENNLTPDNLITASLSIPLLFTSMSLAVALSSQILQDVIPIGWDQFIGAIAISVVFIVLAYSARPIVETISRLDWKTLPKLPLFFLLMSTAIVASSFVLQLYQHIDYGDMLNILFFSLVVGVSFILMAGVLWVVSKIGVENLAKGALGILIVSGVIMASSWILSIGKYDEGAYPSLDWAMGVGLSLVAFSLTSMMVGAMVFGPQGLVFAAGLGGLQLVSAAIVASSHILKEGDYSGGPTKDWAQGVAISIGAFSQVFKLMRGSSFLGIFKTEPLSAEELTNAIETISLSIVASAKIFSDANASFQNPPPEEWARGVGLAIGAFSPVFVELKKQARGDIAKFFLGDGVSTEDMVNAIVVISSGIVSAAGIFASGTTAFKNGPSEEWAKGVGTAIGAFAPVFEVLQNQHKGGVLGFIMGEGPGVEDMSMAIETISRSIVDAAVFFNNNKTAFDGAFPSEDWAKGVGGAIGAFAPVFDKISEDSGWITKGSDVIENMNNAIRSISTSIVASARIFSGQRWDHSSQSWIQQPNFEQIWQTYPSVSWVDNISGVLTAYVDSVNKVSDISPKMRMRYNSLVNSLITNARKLYINRNYFDNILNRDFIHSMKYTILEFGDLIDQITNNDKGGGLGDFMNRALSNDPISKLSDRMITLARGYDAIAESLIKLSVAANALNISDSNTLGNITNDIMKIGYDETMETSESSASGSDSVNVVSPSVERAVNSDKKMMEALNSKFDKMIELLEKLNDINEITNSTLVEGLADERPSSGGFW